MAQFGLQETPPSHSQQPWHWNTKTEVSMDWMHTQTQDDHIKYALVPRVLVTNLLIKITTVHQLWLPLSVYKKGVITSIHRLCCYQRLQTAKKKLTVGVCSFCFGFTVLLVIPELKCTVSCILANMSTPSPTLSADNSLTCSHGTPPTDTSPPAALASLHAPPLCSWGHTGAAETHQNLTATNQMKTLTWRQQHFHLY